jgi:hypothetical protein
MFPEIFAEIRTPCTIVVRDVKHIQEAAITRRNMITADNDGTSNRSVRHVPSIIIAWYATLCMSHAPGRQRGSWDAVFGPLSDEPWV